MNVASHRYIIYASSTILFHETQILQVATSNGDVLTLNFIKVLLVAEDVSQHWLQRKLSRLIKYDHDHDR